MNKEIAEAFFNIFEGLTPQECFDLCTSIIGYNEDARIDTVAISFAKYFQEMFEQEPIDEPSFPLTEKSYD